MPKLKVGDTMQTGFAAYIVCQVFRHPVCYILALPSRRNGLAKLYELLPYRGIHTL